LVRWYSEHSALSARALKCFEKKQKALKINFILQYKGKTSKEQKILDLDFSFSKLSDLQQKIYTAKNEYD
jgi:hypothetical protein